MKKLLFFLFLQLQFSLYAQETPSLLMSQKIKGLSFFWSEVKYNFANFSNLPDDFSWDSVYVQYLDKLLQTQSDYEYFRLMECFAAELKDGHTSVDFSRNYVSKWDFLPLGTERIDKKFYLRTVSLFFLDSFPLGSEIIEVDGMSILEYLKKEIVPYTFASNEGYALYQANRKPFFGPAGKTHHLKYVTPSGDTSTVTMTRNSKQLKEKSVNIKSHQKLLNEEWSPLIFKYLDGKIAWLRYETFSDYFQPHDTFLTFLPKLKKAEAIILDLRNNKGGSSMVGYNLFDFIVKGDSVGWPPHQTRINNAIFKARGYGYEEYRDYYTDKKFKTSSGSYYVPDTTTQTLLQPLVVLTGPRTASAAEDFLIALRNNFPERAILIGEPTAGSTGAPLVFKLPGGGLARICVKHYPEEKKKGFYKNGIVPDILVYQEINALMEGRDLVLEKAVEVLTKKINKNKKR